MALLKNKRGVEALPLRYIIIALVAALVIGIALQFVGILKGGTIGAAQQFNQSVTTRTACELDSTGPVVNAGWLCNNTDYTNCGTTISGTGKIVYVYANVTDNEGGCGIDDYTGVFGYIYRNGESTNTSVSLKRESGDIFKGTFNITQTGTYYVKIYAVDNSTAKNPQRLSNQTNSLTVS